MWVWGGRGRSVGVGEDRGRVGGPRGRGAVGVWEGPWAWGGTVGVGRTVEEPWACGRGHGRGEE